MWPCLVLGAATIALGWLMIPGVSHVVSSFLDGVVPNRSGLGDATTSTQWLLAGVSMLAALAGIGAAWMIWCSGRWAALTTRWQRPRAVLEASFGFDGLYDAALVRPLAGLARVVRVLGEELLVPATIWGPTRLVRAGGGLVSALQSGLLRAYAIGISLAVVCLGVWMLEGRS